MSAANHTRKGSSRAVLPRRSTRGPVGALDDPLSPPGTGTPSLASSVSSPLPQSPRNEVDDLLGGEVVKENVPHTPSTQMTSRFVSNPEAASKAETDAEDERDLSFLLDASIYHPLSQLEVPGPFRKPFLPPIAPGTPLLSSLEQLNELLSRCEFLQAAHCAGMILTSGIVGPTDTETIFHLLEIRYSCLELSGNVLLAAQEAKALEDISSAFYYAEPVQRPSAGQDSEENRRLPKHIMPFTLRLQALRLQSIGFSDPRRGVATLYDTAFECREHLTSVNTSSEDRILWTRRLQEVSVRVVNALVEIGDLDCAIHTMESLKPDAAENLIHWTSRMVLLAIKMGDLSRARHVLETSHLGPHDRLLLQSLLLIAEGRYEDAAKSIAETESAVNEEIKSLVKQNLAVAYLYKGEVQKAKKLLEGLVSGGGSFQTLTVNLATIYDLSSDRARDLKNALISKVAAQQTPINRARAFVNADFKL